jgi:hypothetical protein
MIMSRATSGTIPLAFVLAMSAEALGAVSPGLGDGRPMLEPGMLKPLLERALVTKAFDFTKFGDRRLPGDKTAQYFPNFPNFPNFRNCFSGNWRNC